MLRETPALLSNGNVSSFSNDIVTDPRRSHTPYANAARRTMRAENKFAPAREGAADRSYLRSVISRRGYTPQPEAFPVDAGRILRI